MDNLGGEAGSDLNSSAPLFYYVALSASYSVVALGGHGTYTACGNAVAGTCVGMMSQVLIHSPRLGRLDT